MKYFPLDVLCCVSHTLEQMLALRAHFVLWVPSLAFLLLFFWTINRPVPKIKFYNIAILLYKIDVGIWDSDLSGRSFSRLENAPIWWKTIRNMYVCLFGRSMSKAFGIPMWAITNKACVGLPGIACPISPPTVRFPDRFAPLSPAPAIDYSLSTLAHPECTYLPDYLPIYI